MNKKKLEKELKTFLKKHPREKVVKYYAEKTGLKEEDITNEFLLCIGILNKALKGDISAFCFIRDTIGEKPKKETSKELKAPLIEVKRANL